MVVLYRWYLSPLITLFYPLHSTTDYGSNRIAGTKQQSNGNGKRELRDSSSKMPLFLGLVSDFELSLLLPMFFIVTYLNAHVINQKTST